ncbi:MAG: inositol monophosphatase family protein [Candidatus Zixiibacteriota bacterium]
MSEFLDFARTVVLDAARHVRGFNLSAKVHDKEAGDLVTKGDLRIEEEITRAISRRYPDHGILAEEGSSRNEGAEFKWILDPIDGTKYYFRNLPLYTISLALQRKDYTILGVVYSPEYDRLFMAEQGGGAFLSKDRIKCRQPAFLKESIICLDIPGPQASAERREEAFAKMRILMDNVLRVRLIGASALSLCWTAMGGFDAYLNLNSGAKIWDVAAGLVIVKESGARVSDNDGRIIAACPGIHDKLMEILDL